MPIACSHATRLVDLTREWFVSDPFVDTIDGFTPIKIKFESANSACSVHTIFCKVHVIRQEHSKVPNHKTLFSLGWPPYCNDQCIKELFSQAGEVNFVQLQDKVGFDEHSVATVERGFKVAYIVFDSNETVAGALQLGRKRTPLLCKVGPTGLAKWCSDYSKSRTTVTSIEAQVTDVMVDYDKRKEDSEKKKQRLQKPDKDGWITITRKNPKPIQGKRHWQKKKKKELLNFYQFQLRESKRQHIAELRRKFEEDKKKVAEMKSKRKFKPY